MADRVQFSLNGQLHSVDVGEAAGKTLNEYIRHKTQYTGTKVSCAQGGCGACTVAVARPDEKLRSVTSCLMPLASLHGAAVVTVEGLAVDGKPHPVSERVAQFNGSQCGFCTPGMVMQLFSTLSNQDGGKACVEKDLEQCINGNVCRCTGYRPLIEAAKSFAADTTVTNQCDAKASVGPYDVTTSDPKLVFPPSTPLTGDRWARPANLSELFEAMRGGARVVAGGTAAGIYPDLGMADSGFANAKLADITAVKELSAISLMGEMLRIGATVTWTVFSEYLRKLIADKAVLNIDAFTVLAERCSSIAGSQVRNRATLGGNIAITRSRGFLSDWMPPLAALGAKVEVATVTGDVAQHDLLQFLQQDTDFDGLICAVLLPVPKANVVFRSFRVAKRSRNASALVNAGFAATVVDGKVVQASIVLGAVDPKPVRMKHLERELSGFRSQDLQANANKVLSSLTDQVSADLLPLTCGFGRSQTAHIVSGFMVKFLTAMFAEAVPKDWRSAEYCLHDMERSTTAKQCFPPPTDLGGDLHKPMTKTTAFEQTTGAAKFTDDIPKPMHTLIAAYIVCPEANVLVKGVDAAVAKKLLGSNFHSLITADDLQVNKISMNEVLGLQIPPTYNSDWDAHSRLLLPSSEPSMYGGQPVALLLAYGDAPRSVERAAAACSESLQLERVGTPLIGCMEGGAEVCEPLVCTKGKIPAAGVIEKAKAFGGKSYMTGKFHKKSQSHFYMEGQTVLAVPEEDGITIFAASQGPDAVQKAVAKATGLQQSKIGVKFKRVGGGFGGKLMLPALLSATAAQVALKTKHPIRIVLPREVDMGMCGGRQEVEATWEVAVDPKTSKIEAMKYDIWLAHGAGENMQKLIGHMIGAAIDEVYAIPSITVTTHFAKQNFPDRNAVRAPGHFEANLLMEAVLDGVATELEIPGHVLRERNFFQGKFNTSGLSGSLMPQGTLADYVHPTLWALIKSKTNYELRFKNVEEFNKNNAWKKRGIALAPARYGMALTPGNSARIDIFKDGSIQLALSGAEIGQGLHTKVAQMVNTQFTQELGYGPPISSMRFLETSTEQNPNGGITGGSTTSEGSMFAAGDAVRQLAERLRNSAKKAAGLKPEEKSKDGPWADIIEAAFSTKFLGVLAIPQNLSAVGLHLTVPTEMMYETYGVAASEVELDVLTGEWRILMAHLLFDIGMSYNPTIDIGQMEGAFIMGVGQVQNEGVDFDKATGRLLTDNTWTYKPPIACDIPEHFTVELVDGRKDRVNNPVVSAVMALLAPILGCCAIPWKPTKTKKIYKSAKGIGEPPLLLASAVQSAVYEAMVAAAGAPLPDHSLPMPAKPFSLLPLLEAAKPGGAARDDMSTATGTSASASVAA
mmetsp:Transcript_84868/g.274327  ORF Transcript_84868/g.274327 Transcript_84868/m.274327 type:complete len:1363 (-) Transcript_84868:237-4325(-)|eukprot:CAMPEP_0203929942 /NCGR_PEP_ID=MMETSP0359-20131031/68777_1 /ASSEMBLY_ACC=CAM_ASM_000338 /TAXON_ID=268821 /ORGANISM="Scrippsiella Hangoei, Strain SHTV-5" /LENGTH=1362 /DNA_ID=CAMNT_0050859055 /DNA_START=53 /DNA_END=4141 /DNA_ORIENTATION=-